MNVTPEVKSIVKLELVTRKPKTYTEALHIVGQVLKKYATPHVDIFDKRRACSRFCKATVTAV